MSAKNLIWIGMVVGSTVGSFIPVLWGASTFSDSSIVFSTIGGIAGVLGGFKLSKMF